MIRRRPPAVRACEYDAEHVLLVTSPGGHLAQLMTLRPWWGERRRTWVSFDSMDVRSRLGEEELVFAHHPTTRNIPNLLRNFRLAWRVMMASRPDLVVSTGAGVALPFFVLARILGTPSVYIEVVDRISTRTLTGRCCYHLATRFLVQWPEQLQLYPTARVVGVLA